MKILFLSPNQVGVGGYYRSYDLGRFLSEKGFKITMVCGSGAKLDFKIRKKKINNNFELITLPWIKYGKYLSGQEIRLLISIWQVLTYDYDILHAFAVAQPQVGIPAIIARYLRKKKLFVDWHDAWDEGLALKHKFPTKQILSFCDVKIVKHAHIVTVIGKWFIDKAKRIGIPEEKIVEIPIGSNADEIKPLDKDVCLKKLGLVNGPFLVSGGRYYDGKTMSYLLDSFEKVLQEVPNVKLLILSTPHIDKSNIRKIKKLGSNIIRTGEVPQSLYNYYLCVADVCILPMDNNVFEKARMPTRFTEYLCAGRAIVSNVAPGGIVEDAFKRHQIGIACKFDDIKGMANAIIELLKNPTKREKLGKQARDFAMEDWYYPNIVNLLANLYKSNFP